MNQYCVGVDVGGTTVKCGIFTLTGVLMDKWEVPTRKEEDGKYILPDVADALKKRLCERGIELTDIEGIGIGVPGPVEPNGYVHICVNLGWHDHWPAKEMQELMGGRIRCAVGNDANVAALGEMWQGGGKGHANLVMVTLGTGVGSGIVCDGKVVYGSDGFAGELGHLVIDHSGNGRSCGCGRKGCLETYTSATGVARTAREFLANRSEESLLRSLDPERITSFDVFQAAEKGDKIALDIFNYTGRLLGTACADFATFNSPEAFVFFGGLTKAGDYIMNPIREAYEENCLSMYKGKAKLLISALNGSEAAVLGASALGWE